MRLLPKNPLFRLLFINAMAGVTAALVVVSGLYWFDIGGLQRMTASDTAPLIPVVMLIVMFVITLGSAAMGAAIMAIPRDDEPGSGKRAKTKPAEDFSPAGLIPARVPAGKTVR